MRAQQRSQIHTYITHFQEGATAKIEYIFSFPYLQVGDNKRVLMFVRIKVNKICKRLRTLENLLSFSSLFFLLILLVLLHLMLVHIYTNFSAHRVLYQSDVTTKNPGFQCPITTNIFLACRSVGNFSLRGLQIGWSWLLQDTTGSGFSQISLVVGPKLSSKSYMVIFFSWKSKKHVKTHDA